MKQIKITNNFKQYKDGLWLIQQSDIDMNHHLTEGEPFVLTIDDDAIGKGIYGIQNKGVGSLFTTDLREDFDEFFVKDQLYQALESRQSLFNQDGINCLRLFNDIGDGIGGVTIDLYDTDALVTFYNRGIHMYRHYFYDALDDLLDCDVIIEQQRFLEQVTHEVIKGDPTYPKVVQEHHINYMIDLLDGAMSGLFMDQRDVRNKIIKNYTPRNMLNLFSYSGSFSIVAALNGATTTSVDAANRTTELIERNMALNEIDPTEHSIYIMDVFNYFDYAKKHQLMYDFIMIDPPSFARVNDRIFSVLSDYPKLIKDAVEVVEDNGTIVLSTNHSDISLKDFKKMIDKTMSTIDIDYTIEHTIGLPKDYVTSKHYKKGKYLKVVFLNISKMIEQ